MVVKILQDEETKKPVKIVKKVFKDLDKIVAKGSNCLLKEEQDFLTKFSFSNNIHKIKLYIIICYT